MKKLILIILLITALTPTSMKAQKNNIIDEVIWVVGDEAILRSDVEEARMQAEAYGAPIKGDPYCIIPEQIAVQKLFLHQAELDSIVPPSESTITNEVERMINYYISELGSKEKVEEYFQQSINELRERRRKSIREQQVAKEMQQKLVENIKSTPADVRRFFNQMPTDSIPVIPSQVELQIVSFEPVVKPEEISRIKDKLRELSERINSGKAEFSTMARFYSEDPESAKRGGELGFFGKGVMAPEFTAVAFNLSDPKKVSRIVQTEFGFHIIQLIEKRGDRINCRHILIKPHVSYDDKEKAINALDSISNDIRTNKITFEQAVMAYSQDKTSAMNAGLMLNNNTGTSKFEYQELPVEIAKAAYKMNVGEISKPFSMVNPANNKEMVAVIKLKSKTETHKANLADDYQMLKNLYEEQKKQEFLRNWIISKQKETYVKIDPKWQKCEFQYPGWLK